MGIFFCYYGHYMLSVVVPLYNEHEVIPELIRRLLGAGKQWGEYEVIFVDDGSSDQTPVLIEQAAAANPQFRLLRFSRNFGHQAAVSAGLAHAQGAAVAVIDGDLQDPPESIAALHQRWQEGYEVVYAIRTQRKEHVFKRAAYTAFYHILKMMSRTDIPLDAGDFCLMDRKIVDIINALPERNRFVRGLRAWSGFRSIGVPYEREQRFAGAPKYTFRKLVRLAFDGITSFSTAPLKVATYVGFVIAVISFVSGLFLIVQKVVFGVDVQGWTSVMVAIFFMGGVQLVLMGVVGEYIGRIYIEVQGRPIYLIAQKIGFGKD